MRILLVLDATDFNKEQLHFPCYIATLEKGDVTALLVENLVRLNEPISKYGYLEGFNNPYKSELLEKKKIIEDNIRGYQEACSEIGLSGHLLQAGGMPENEIIEASRFADLLLISPTLSFDEADRDVPTKFAEEILSSAQCPVLVVPPEMQDINEVFFAYNGGFSSVYAIRQFTHLFPSFHDKKITVLYVPENSDETTVHKRRILEYLHSHYKNVEFKMLTGNPSDAIRTHLKNQKNCIVTFGAYGRSKLSRFFKQSSAESILKKLKIPVFITYP